MSSIDLTNPQVLRNHLIAKMKEGKGEFKRKKDVIVFVDDAGSEIVAPEECEAYLPKKLQKKKKKKDDDMFVEKDN